jgi:hypothetical protein
MAENTEPHSSKILKVLVLLKISDSFELLLGSLYVLSVMRPHKFLVLLVEMLQLSSKLF